MFEELYCPPEVSTLQLADGYPALAIETEFCTATLALHGAHLIHWQPAHTEHPVLYTSPTAIFKEGKAIRGGIPVCWPWFNAHPTEPDKQPSHGVARNRFWKLESCRVENGVAEISLVLPPDTDIASHVPFPYELKATFSLGKICTVAIETTNRSSQNQAVGGALHTYLALSNVNEISIGGLQNTAYLDTTLQPEETKLQSEEALKIEDAIDRIYYGTEIPLTLRDPAWNRDLVVRKENSLSTVVWNPWKEGAVALKDLPDEAFGSFACIEAANARHDTRILAPSTSHRLATTLEIHPH